MPLHLWPATLVILASEHRLDTLILEPSFDIHRNQPFKEGIIIDIKMASYGSSTTPWQDRLEEACRDNNFPSPQFELVSDRRGGRTAWSSRVMVKGQVFQARFWYDGKNLNNAKEDAAELALHYVSSSPSSPWQ